MEAIKETVAGILFKLQEKKEGKTDTTPSGLLKRCLTKKELEHIKFSYFKKGVVGITVDSSAWLYQLSLQKVRILQTLSEYSKDIKDIRFRLGEI